MTTKEFLILAKNYENNTISEEEKVLLFRFCERKQFKNISDTWDVSQDEESQAKLLNKILRSTRRNNRKHHQTLFYRFLKSSAAILIAIGLGILIYYQSDTSTQDLISNNAITITLEDGTIQVLEEKEMHILTNKTGVVIGRQNSGKLVYNTNKFSGELKYNTINVPYGKSFEVQFSDGTTAFLNAGTSIRYPIQFLENYNRTIYVDGEVFLNVSKDRKHPFIVKTKDMDIKVLGTKFNVNAYDNELISEITLLEGSVSLQNNLDKNKNTTVLEPGQLGAVVNKNTSIEVREVDAANYIKWTKGELVFKNMPFETILKKLERHYNYTIINKNSATNQIIFNASFGQESLEAIFKSLKENYGIDYRIENKTITIY